MIHFILMTHGTWGRALVESAQLVVGEIDSVHTLPLLEGQSLSDYQTEAERTVLALGAEEKILIADMMGGSPYYVAASLSRQYGCPALSGLSMELLLALCRARETLNAGDAAGEAVLAARYRTGTVQEQMAREEDDRSDLSHPQMDRVERR